jgi:hypothetical protein
VKSDTKFAPVIVLSQIKDGRDFGGQAGKPGPDIAVIVEQWHPMYRDTTHAHFVRGVPVSRTSMTEEHGGRRYRWCVFPDDYRVMLVNEGNISSKRIQRV